MARRFSPLLFCILLTACVRLIQAPATTSEEGHEQQPVQEPVQASAVSKEEEKISEPRTPSVDGTGDGVKSADDGAGKKEDTKSPAEKVPDKSTEKPKEYMIVDRAKFYREDFTGDSKAAAPDYCADAALYEMLADWSPEKRVERVEYLCGKVTACPTSDFVEARKKDLGCGSVYCYPGSMFDIYPGWSPDKKKERMDFLCAQTSTCSKSDFVDGKRKELGCKSDEASGKL